MKTTRGKSVILASIFVLAAAVLIALDQWKLAQLVTLIAVCGVLVLLADTRTVLSRRIKSERSQTINLLTQNSQQNQGASDQVSTQTKNSAGASVVAGASTNGSGSKQVPATSPIAPKPDARVAKIIDSGLFSQSWYEAQVVAKFNSNVEAIKHYLDIGFKRGYSPNPLMVPKLVKTSLNLGNETEPLTALLDRSRKEGVEFNSIISSEKVSRNSAQEEPIKYLWANQNTELSEFTSAKSISIPGTVADVMEAAKETFDDYYSYHMEIKPAIFRGAQRPQMSNEMENLIEDYHQNATSVPLVTVVLPTWNRARKLRKAIESIQKQKYQNWELVIADDGSTDDTVLAVEAEAGRDARIRLVKLPHQGVCAARNAAIQAGNGKYVAFLDSDKTWEPDFLWKMIAVMETNGWEVASSSFEVNIGNRTYFLPNEGANSKSLLRANSYDQTAVVSLRSKILEFGGFDESLPRAVDYDLNLSLSEVSEFHHVPFVGIRYSEDPSDPNRISEAYSIAWNFHVRDKHLKRRELANIKRSAKGKVSAVVTLVNPQRSIFKVIDDLSAQLGDSLLEVTVVTPHTNWNDYQEFIFLKMLNVKTSVVIAGPDQSLPGFVNQAAYRSEGEYLLLLDANQSAEEGAVQKLVDMVKDGECVAAHGPTISRTRLISEAGVVYPGGAREPIALGEGMPTSYFEDLASFAVPGAPLPLVCSRDSFIKIGGFDAKLRNMWADIDFSQRLSLNFSLPVAVDPSAQFESSVPTLFKVRNNSGEDLWTYREKWPVPPEGTAGALSHLNINYSLSGFEGTSFPDNPKKWVKAVPSNSKVSVGHENACLNWSIRTAAPADQRRHNWGDFHFAESLAASLRKLGQRVSVDFFDNAERGSGNIDDVTLNLRGLRDIPLPASSVNLMWIISHPDQVTKKEVSRYDSVFAASESWATKMSGQWLTKIEPLLQCTDPSRFFIDDSTSFVEPEILEKLQSSSVLVGNSRKQYRPSAWQIGNAELPLMVWGSDWDGLIPAECVFGTSIPNTEVHHYYRHAKFVLNDHWSDMKNEGFISNRIFDVLASGGRLVTDDVVGLDRVLPDGSVLVFKNPLDLIQKVSTEPENDYEVRKSLSDLVRQEHSFDRRAEVLLEAAKQARGRIRL